ncbi:hypothetical protein SC1083_0097 [Aggregatibacter actinomycetemcomitans serotype e str. SC1083]|uniref:Uncharacterized protein n=1 Tax=Aggregatibacter actinomycetemcomitans serotype e str. SC1083 TaxID=907488 RepID=G4A5L2_AGGAC|nr:hypothetical protein SC1083_0097 [Aggregatibacter actinomycetemcomitans serotype e str. SC1083]
MRLFSIFIMLKPHGLPGLKTNSPILLELLFNQKSYFCDPGSIFCTWFSNF